MTDGKMRQAERSDWQVTVFCHNERAGLGPCLQSIEASADGRRILIVVIVNGSTDGSLEAARAACLTLNLPVKIFNIALADKSNAINVFIHDLSVRGKASLYFCVDAYTIIKPGSFSAIERCLAESPNALTASGIAGAGRTEVKSFHRTVEVGGVLKGQFYALRPTFVERIAAAGLRLPVGLYRGDGLLGSMAAHDLDAVSEPWDNKRLIGVRDAVFTTRPLSPFKISDVRRQLRRTVRQMRGRIENAAIKQIIYRDGYSALPAFADDMIGWYLANHPPPHVSLSELPFMARALIQHRAFVRPSVAETNAHRVI